MLQLTQQATKHLLRVRGERGHGQKTGARFVRSGAGVGLTFSPRPEPGDRVMDADGIEVYVAPEVVEKLDGRTVDVGDVNGRTSLFFKRAKDAAKGAKKAASAKASAATTTKQKARA